ncbi:MAG: hypothetical protein IJZ29_05130 [Clostridia bacterium]|nr:hypothetical protein [Clostridia bacterium]
MKNWITVGLSILAVAVILVICIFVIPLLTDMGKENNKNKGNEVVADVADDLEDYNDTLIFNIDITEYFVGESLDLRQYFTCVDINNFDIVINCSNYSIVTNGFEICSMKAGSATFSIYYKHTGSEADYALLRIFTIMFYDKITEIESMYNSNSINEFLITLLIKDDIDYTCLDYSCDDLIIKSIETNSNIITILVDIVNSFTGSLTVSYEKIIEETTDSYSKTIELKQDYENYFSILNLTTFEYDIDNVNLQITNDLQNHNNSYCFNEISIVNGLAISNIDYEIRFNKNIIDVLEINGIYKITAKALGSTVVEMLYENEILYDFVVEVKNVPITSASSSAYQYSGKVNELIDISPISVEPCYAIYEVNYSTLNANCLIDNGCFIASKAGIYDVTIVVSNFNYNVTITITEDVVIESKIILVGNSGEYVSTINANANETRFYTIISEDLSLNDISLDENLICLINGNANDEIIEISVYNNELISIKFVASGNYELKLKLKNKEITTDTIILNIN